MDIIQAIILGAIQGATEFIPVSSSAHLVLFPWLLGWQIPSVAFDTILHLGTLLAAISYFWRDWLGMAQAVLRWLGKRDSSDPRARLLLFVLVGTIPAAILGFLFKDFFESVFQKPVIVAGLLLVTAAILTVSERLGRQERGLDRINFVDTLVIGIAQAIAILPGVSRSGSTIGAGLTRGLQRESAARFSFLLSTPIIAGAGALGLKDLIDAGIPSSQLLSLAAGFVAALVVGYAVIGWLLRYLQSKSTRVFAYYCVALALICFAVAALNLRAS